jgi:hypothetical protein
MLHFAWLFLDAQSRVQARFTSRFWALYIRWRYAATTAPIARLRSLRPPPGNPSVLCPRRAQLYASGTK